MSDATISNNILILSGSNQPSGTKTPSYKLQGGNKLYKLNVSWTNTSTSSQKLYIKLDSSNVPSSSSSIYDTITIYKLSIDKYTPNLELSKNGIFIFNNPSNYIKLGYEEVSSGIYKSIS